MQFFKSVSKETGHLQDRISDAYTEVDIESMENSAVTFFYVGMTIGDTEITQQNNKGYVSVKHIKEAIQQRKNNLAQASTDRSTKEELKELYAKFNTTQAKVEWAIHALSTGRRMDSSYDTALNLIGYNQEINGSWHNLLNN